MSLGQGDWVGVVLLPSAGLTKYTQMQVSHHHLWESDSVPILTAGSQALLSFQMGVAHVLGPLPPPQAFWHPAAKPKGQWEELNMMQLLGEGVCYLCECQSSKK